MINLSLNIGEQILKSHHSHIEWLLSSVTDDSEFMSIVWVNLSLIEEWDTIHHTDKEDVLNSSCNVGLQ